VNGGIDGADEGRSGHTSVGLKAVLRKGTAFLVEACRKSGKVAAGVGILTIKERGRSGRRGKKKPKRLSGGGPFRGRGEGLEKKKKKV